MAAIAAGRAKVGKTMDGFDVVASVPVVVGDDVVSCAELVRWYAALYIGGMGSREQNFYNQLAIRMGFGDAAREVQDLYLDKRQRDAAAAVPLEFIDQTSLLGPVDRIAEGMRAYAQAGVTTLSVNLFAGDVDSAISTLRTVAEALNRSGVGE
jgi:alkanesulfonate monooxygenase SsuD/methylene tetrahydromethanopterin reductase-like flavin-dependent oxidoreductase (luciferase family)